MAEQVPIVDGFQSLLGGMHAGLDPETLPENSYSSGLNVTCRGGLVKTRPGFVRGPQLPAGVFLGMKSWSLHATTRLVVVLSGRVVLVDTVTSAVTDLGVLLDASALCNFIQADRFLVILNGVNRPLVLKDVEGVPTVHPTPASFPTGALGEYVFGRIHMSPNKVPNADVDESLWENGRPYFLSSDVMQPWEPTTVLSFTENEYWAEGGANGPPAEMGYITAFAPIRNASTGTGYGQLLVFAERGVAAFDVSVARSEWKDTGIAQVLFFGPGSVSPWATIPVNSTIMYRSADGMRIVSYAAAAGQSTGEILSNVPQSTEVGPFLDDAESYFPRVSAASVSNRIYITAGGADDVWFQGMVVLDAARVTTMASPKSETAYDGAWQITGRLIGGIVGARRGLLDTLFVYCDDGCIWRLDETATDDNGLTIHSRLVTRGMTGASGPDRKRLLGIDLWVRGITTSGSLVMRYRPTEFPYWATAGSQAYLIGAGSLPQKRHFTWAVSYNSASPCDAGEKSFLNTASTFQFAIDWDGPITLTLFRCLVASEPDGAMAPCGDTSARTVTVPSGAEELGVWLER